MPNHDQYQTSQRPQQTLRTILRQQRGSQGQHQVRHGHHCRPGHRRVHQDTRPSHL